MKKEKIFRLTLIASLSLANLVRADQILYDGFTGIPSGYLSSPDEFDRDGLYLFGVLDYPVLIGYLEEGILMDRKDIHSIGQLYGDYLYANNGSLLGSFKARAPVPER